jgi:uncharacterized protein YjiS (DUF1127 family)
MRIRQCCDAALLLLKQRHRPILRMKTDSPAAAAGQDRGFAMFASIVRAMRAWKRYHQSLSELNRLGDRELADIGISRSDIPRVAWSTSHKH